MADYEWDMPFTRPDWFPQGTYNWTRSESPVVPNMMQTWWRSPSWGSGAVWHPYYGYQPWKDIKQQYQGAEGPVTWEQFTNWGYTPQMNPDWSQYGFTLDTGGGGNMNGYGNISDYLKNWGVEQYGKVQPQTYQYGTPNANMFGQQMPYQGLNYPQQWGTATNVLNPMAYTGMPSYQDPWYQQAKQVAGYDIQNQMSQAAEQMGLRGLRYSTPMAAESQRIAGETMARTGLEWTGRELDALEQARQRQLSATGQLAGLGGQYFQAPMQAAQALSGYGTGLQQQQQDIINKYLQEFQRMTPEASPWLQAAYQWSGYQWPGAQPEMYQPSFWQQLLGGLF